MKFEIKWWAQVKMLDTHEGRTLTIPAISYYINL